MIPQARANLEMCTVHGNRTLRGNPLFSLIASCQLTGCIFAKDVVHYLDTMIVTTTKCVTGIVSVIVL